MQLEKSLVEAFCIISMVITMLELVSAKLQDLGETLERILAKVQDLVRRWRG